MDLILLRNEPALLLHEGSRRILIIADIHLGYEKILFKRQDYTPNLTEVISWKEENLRSTIKNFKCPSCGYDKAHLETRQTRRADEGMTHFITCLKCGRHIKIRS